MHLYESITVHPSGSQDWDTNYACLVLKKDKFTLHGFEITSNGEGTDYYRKYGRFVVQGDKLILTVESCYGLNEETSMALVEVYLKKIEEAKHGKVWKLCEQTAEKLRKLECSCLERNTCFKSTITMKLCKKRRDKLGTMIKAPYRPFNQSSWSQYGKTILHEM